MMRTALSNQLRPDAGRRLSGRRGLALALFVATCVAAGRAVPTVDTSSTATTQAMVQNVPHTTSGTERLMIVGVSIGQDITEVVDTITYNSVPLTKLDTRNSPSNQMRVEIWYLVAPDTGTHNVTVTFDNTTPDGAAIGVITFNGVDQFNPLGPMISAAGVSGNASATVSAATDELVFSVVGVDDGANYNLTPNGTEHWDLDVSEANGGGNTRTGAGSTLMDWTWAGTDDWAIGAVAIKPPATSRILISTDNDVGSPGADGLPGGWTEGQVLAFGGTDLTHGDPTDGDLSIVVDFDIFTTNAVDVGALQYVSRNLTVGGVNGTFDLLVGDLLVSFLQDETVVGAYTSSGFDEDYFDEDLVVFRPISPGNYTDGTFYMLLDNVVPDDLKGGTLIEENTTIGGTPVSAGSFLVIQESSTDESVDLFVPTGVGLGSTTGPVTPLIDTVDVGIDANRLRAIEVIESATTVGTYALSAGDLLVSLNVDDNVSGVGSNNLLVLRNDVFVLTLTATGLGTTDGTAAMFLVGDDVGLDDNPVAENPYGIALFQTHVDSTAPFLRTNRGSIVSEGGTDTLRLTELRYGDDLQPPSSVTYTVTSGPAAGQLESTTDPGNPITVFTQAEIDDDEIVYVHSGTGPAKDSFTFDVDDGLGHTLVGQSFSLSIGIVEVDTINDDSDGDTSSIAALSDDRGPDGLISLREAIEATNASGNGTGPDEIHFEILDAPVGGVHTIDVGGTANGAFDQLSDPVVIDGTTDSHFGTTPIIELDGTNAGNVIGLDVTASGCTFRGLVVNRFTRHGISLGGTGGNLVQGCYIGTDPGGTLDRGNTEHGILITGANNTIGGTMAGESNLISGNGWSGISLQLDSADGNLIHGNLIGTDINGTTDLPNGIHGIEIWSGGPDNNTVGGTAATAGNVISGNVDSGVFISSAGTTGNTLLGNYIGTNAAGTGPIPNLNYGVQIASGATDNTIGGSVADAGNVISGNGKHGVSLTLADRTAVLGNLIGTNAAGNAAIFNGEDAIHASHAADSVFGGTDPLERNVIVASNGDTGLDISGSLGTGNTVEGNFFGTDINGTSTLGGGSFCISLSDAPSTTIGGTAAGADNLIAGYLVTGITISSNCTGTTIEGNYIGTDAAGTADMTNGFYGITVQNSTSDIRIGGDDPAAGNLIANHSVNGVKLYSNAGSNLTVLGNRIYNNTDIGLSLGPAGVNYNDPEDADSGVNDLLNFPVFTNVVQDGPDLDIDFEVDLPTGTYRIEIFENPNGLDSTGFGQGEVFLGAVSVSPTGAAGYETFSRTLTGVTATSIATVVATATEDLGAGYGGTSEFGPAFVAMARLVVDTDNDVSDGTTTSITALLGDRGPDGVISLREAIEATNNTPNGASPDEIHFEIPGSAPHTIDVGNVGDGGNGPLDDLIQPVVIDGTTDMDFSTTPIIELNGTDAGAGASGLRVLGGDSTIRGLVINRFDDNGIEIVTGDGNTIETTYVGTNVAGTAALPNLGDGIDVKSSGNVIGGTSPGVGNIVSGNGDDGIQLVGSSATGNFVQGNLIGVDVTGRLPIPNDETGMQMSTGASGNTIGGTSAAARNIISGNTVEGVGLRDSGTTGNVVLGNYIGVDIDGDDPIPNQNGVLIETGAAGNTIGGTATDAGNVISGNTVEGIVIYDTSGTTIQGNLIGVDSGVTVAVPNGDDGIDVRNSPNTVIGGTAAGAGNVISGNTDEGIQLWQSGTTGTIVQGNAIGTNLAGTLDLGNGESGIWIASGPHDNLIGGATSTAKNLIAHNGTEGVTIESNAGNNNAIIGNVIRNSGALAIDIDADGVTNNDAEDATPGANDMLNFPVLLDVVQSGPDLDITFAVDLQAGDYRIEFYENPSGLDPTTFGEGEAILGAVVISPTGAVGYETFSRTLVGVTATAINTVVATATEDFTGSYGSTSEFGPAFVGAGRLIVDTDNDAIDGTTTSIAALLGDRGPDGLISLREAIEATNNTPNGTNPDEIHFDIPGAAPYTIDVGNAGDGSNGPLPPLTQAVVIDGSSEPDFGSTPVIRIDGQSAGGGEHGLDVTGTASDTVIRALMITRFGGDGIIVRSGADDVTIAGNWIGTTGTGSTGVGNTNGIELFAAQTTVGGASSSDRNVITNNTNEGINIVGTGVTNHVIRRNIIGLDPDGSTGGGNSDVGIAIISGSGNTIGGSGGSDGNIISMNFEGIEINTDNNIVQGNYIGTDLSGSLDRGNRSDDGIEIQGGAGNLIGGSTPAAANVISGNTEAGIHIVGEAADGNTIRGNSIGINAAGTAQLPNGEDAIMIRSGADGTIIGGTGADEGNWISAPGGDSIDINGASSGTIIQGNRIGTDLAGTADWGAQYTGVNLEAGASNTMIGGTAMNAGNIIAFCGSNPGNPNAITLQADAGTGNAILGNTIYSNVGLGIDLEADGVSGNDGLKPATPNLGMDFPVFTSVRLNGTSLTVSGYVGSAPGQALFANARVEIFKSDEDATGFGQGLAYLDFLTADGSGNFSGSITVAGLSIGDEITGTATDGSDNTSEFSGNTTVDPPLPAGITVTPTSGLTTTEAGGTDTFDIVLDTQPTADVTIALSSSDTGEGTVSPTSLTFTNGDWNVAQTVTVTGIDDPQVDGNIAYTIVTAAAVSGDTDYNGLNASDVSVSNTDNDTAGISVTPTSGLTTTEAGGTDTFDVVLDTQPTADVTIALSSSDTGEGTVSPTSLTFTNGDWNAAQTVTVTGVDDPQVDGNIAYTIVTAAAVSGDTDYSGLNASDVSVSNTDNDTAGISVTPTSGLTTTEAGGTDTFDIVLDTQPTADVTIALSSSDTGEGTVSPTSLTFTNGDWNVAQTVTVTGVDDPQVDGNIAYTIITAAAVSGDTDYNGLNASDVSVSNTDNDTAGISVTPTSGLTTTEAGGTDTFDVVLDTQPTADVTIALSSSDTGEGTVSPTSLTFTNGDWNAAQTVTVTGVDDPQVDGNIAYTIVTAAAVSGDTDYNGLNASDVSVSNTDNDTAGISVTPTSGLTTTEAGGTDTFDIVLDTQPTADVTIALSSSDTGEGTVSPTSLTFTNGDWNVAQTVTVTGVDDPQVDGNIAYTIITAAAVSGDTDYSGLNASDVSVSNTDNDTAGITVTPTSGLTTTEAGGTDTFDVVLDTQPTADVTIALSSSDTGEGTVSPTSLTFTNGDWNVAQTVTVTGVDDPQVDGNIAYTIITAAAVSGDTDYSGLNASDVSVSNTDNDTAGISVTPTSGLTTTEGGGTDTFDIVLDTQPTADVTIALSSSDTGEGTVSPTSLTFTNGDWNVAQTVTVTGVDDPQVDGNIAYTIVTAAAVSGDTDYSGLNASDVSVSNTDNDTAGITVTPTSGLTTTESGGTDTFDVVLDTQPTADVTIALSSSDTGEGTVSPTSLTFTNGDWNVAQTVTVTGVDDPQVDGNIAYTIVTAAAVSGDTDYSGLNASDVSVSNTDNDTAGITVTPTSGLTTTEAGGTDTFDVVLDTQPTADVTIALSSSDTGEGTVSPTSLTFTNGDWNVAQTVTVTGVDDPQVDGNIAYTIITAAAVSGDTDYSGLNASDVSVSNTDNDTAGITVTPTSGLTTTEAGGTDTFDIVLDTQPTADVTIALSSSDTGEGTVSPTSLTFTNGDWNVAQTVTVTGVDDPQVDGNIAYTIVTAAAVSGDTDYSGLNASDVSVSNTDNDTAGITVTPTSGLTTTEAGGTDTFDVVLDTQPTADVTIALSSSDTGEGTVSPTSLTFTNGNWSTPQTVTVTGVDDAAADGNIAYTITTAAAVSGDTNYNGLNASDVSVTNTDDDTPGITVTPTSGLTTTEAGGTSTFIVVLETPPTADVTIALSSSDTGEGVPSPTSLTFTNGNWSIAQAVTVTGVDDALVDGSIAYTIITAAAVSGDAGYNGLNASDVSVSNTDDDTPGITVSPTNGLVTTEAGGAAAFSVVLDSQPTSNVTVAISSSNTDEGTVSPTSLTFTNGNWNTARTVTVTGVDDHQVDGNIAYTIITAAAVSGDADYSGLNPSDVSVTNADDDTGPFLVNNTGSSVAEGGTDPILSTELRYDDAVEPPSSVTFTVTSGPVNGQLESTTAPGSPIASFTQAEINAGQIVYVHNDSNTTSDAFGFDVDDGFGNTLTGQTFGIVIGAIDDEVPAQVNNTGSTAVAGGDDPITASELRFDDVGQGPASVTYTIISPPAHGQLESTARRGTPITSFTQADINAGRIVYAHDGLTTAPDSFRFDVSDGRGNVLPGHSFAIAVTAAPPEPGVTLTAAGTLNTSEAGQSASFTVVLNAPPSADVQILFVSDDESEGRPDPNQVSFTPANWNQPQTVLIRSVNDDIADGPVAYAVLAITSSADADFDGLSLPPVNIINADDDQAGIIVSLDTIDGTASGNDATPNVDEIAPPTPRCGLVPLAFPLVTLAGLRLFSRRHGATRCARDQVKP